jgi:predicted TIM-barrel fold metal-dependent hydrolase
MRAANVVQAWAGSFDALLHRDVASVNRRLSEDCRRFGNGLLIPFGTVNPALPDWREELRRCSEEYRMPGIRVHPPYHGYQLSDKVFADLLAAATTRRLIVQIAVLMEDERTQHPLLRSAPLDLAKGIDPIGSTRGARIQILNHSRLAAPLVEKLLAAGDVMFDFAMVENTHGIEQLLGQIPAERIAFGSYFPFYYQESAILKLKEAALPAARLQAMYRDNAKRFLGATR